MCNMIKIIISDGSSDSILIYSSDLEPSTKRSQTQNSLADVTTLDEEPFLKRLCMQKGTATKHMMARRWGLMVNAESANEKRSWVT